MIMGLGLKLVFYLLTVLMLAITIIIFVKIGSSEGGFGLAFGSAMLILLVYVITEWGAGIISTILFPAYPLMASIITWVVTAVITFIVMWAVYCKTRFDMSGAGGFFAALFTAIIFVIEAAVFVFLFTFFLSFVDPAIVAWFLFP